jgi:hypothetical protein
LKIGSAAIVDNSVRSVDIRHNDVRSSDVRNGSLLAKDFEAGQLAAGEKGASGAAAGPFPTTLPAGKSETGVFGLYGHGEENDGVEIASGDITFVYPLATAPSVKLVQFGTASSPPECPGTAAAPTAAAGWLCVYENREQNERSGRYPQVMAPGSGSYPSAGRFGATLALLGQAAGTDWFFWSEGTWAVTAL